MSWRQALELAKTGQTTCYDSGGTVIACTGTGQDGDIQAGVAWPSPRFINNSDGTVTDNLTGLMWTQDGNAPGPVACFPAMRKTWQQALDYVACLNANSYLSYSDWRLPNLIELESLIDAEQSISSVWLNTQGFSYVQSFYYWSSASSAYYPVNAWFVNFYSGYISFNDKHYDYLVWPVRSGKVTPLVHSLIGSVTENGVGLSNVTMNLSGDASDTMLTATDGTYSFPNLSDGSYNITPSLAGYSFNPPSMAVVVTGSDVTGQDFTALQTWFEENDSAIIYTSTWSNYTCTSCSAGGAKISNTTGSRAEFSFTGTGIKWIVAKGNMMGKARVYLDGVNMGLVDLYSPTLKYQVFLPKTGLPPSVHTVTLEVSGQKNTSSTGTYINIGAFEIVPELMLAVFQIPPCPPSKGGI